MTEGSSKPKADVERWLAQIGLDRYAKAFADADLDLDVIGVSD
jgi:SAM domain (Sterile alpha motif)